MNLANHLFIPIIMRKSVFLALLSTAFIALNASAQIVANGSFENNTATCNPNLSNTSFNTRMQSAFAYGAASQLDIIKDTCGFGPAQDGHYYIGIAVNINNQHDALSLALSTPLSANKTYKLSYYVKKAADYDASKYVLSGSTDSSKSGTTIAIVPAPTDTNWQLKEYTFYASIPVKYINIEATGAQLEWTHLDHFELTQLSTGLSNASAPDAGFSVYPNPASTTTWIKLGTAFENDASISITDLTGRILKSLATYRQEIVSIDIASLLAGTYVIHVSSGNTRASQCLVIYK